MFSSSASSPFESEWPADKEEEFNARSRVTALVLFLLLFGVVLVAIFAYAAMMGATDSRGEHTDEAVIGSKSLGGGPSPPIKSTGYVVTRAVSKETTAETTARLTTTPRPNGTEVAAGLINKALNRKYAPCDDFYNFVCSAPSSGQSVLYTMNSLTKQAIRNMLSTMHVPTKFQKATEKAAALYRACIKLASDQQRNEMDAVKNFLRRLYLDISDLDYDPNFPVLHRLVYLNFIYGFPALIKFHTILYLREKFIYMEINHADENWIKDSHKKFSGPTLESFYAEYLSAYDSQLNVTIAKDIIRAERFVMDFLTTLRKRPFRALTIFAGKLGTLTRGYVSNEHWLRLIQMATFNKVKSTSKVYLPENSTALVVLLLDKKRMSRSDSRLLIAWSLVRQLIPLASGKFMNSAAQQKYKNDQQSVPRFCYDYIIGVMPLAVSQRYVRNYMTPSALAFVRQLTGNLMGALLKKLNQTEWIAGNLWCMMYEKALKLTFLMAYPEAVSPAWLLEAFYFDVPDIAESFTTPFLAARRLITMNSFRDDFSMNFDTGIVDAFYERNKGLITITAGILQPPVFIPGAPAAFNYGGIGQIAGHEVMHAFDVIGIERNVRQGAVSLENTVAKQLYISNVLCLRSSYLQTETEPRGRSLDALTDSEGFCDLAGLQLSYAAYQSLPDAQRWATVPDVGLTSEQTFFVAHCLKWCTTFPGTRRSPKYRYWHRRSRCIVPLRNMREFADAFSCKPGDRMNPVKKCSFW